MLIADLGIILPTVEKIKDNEEKIESERLLLPPVEIVVVAHNPDKWFREVLASFAVQNYPNLRFTVLATNSIESIEKLAAEYLPQAEVHPVSSSHGVGRNFNTLLEREKHPAFYLFCHHDVSLAPDAVRLMVEESFRSNAAVIGPKIVNWDRPNELLDVGYEMDKFGYPISRVEKGELDQEQHDAVSEVFVVSTTATLIRADLFEALEGFDEVMGMIGEDVDLCWRSKIAGAKVMIVPLAIARHQEEPGNYQISNSRMKNRERHRLRGLLSNYGMLHSVRVLPQAFIFSMVFAISGVFSGNLSRLKIFLDTWGWNLFHAKSLLEKRKCLKRLRQVPDSGIRQMQVRGVAPVKRLFVHPEHSGSYSEQNKGRFSLFLQEIRSGPSRVSLAFLIAASVIFIFGSRHLITRSTPVVGDLVPFDLGIKGTFDLWFSSQWQTGIGYEGVHPNALGIIGVLGIVFWGCMGFLRLVLTLGMVPIGVLGIWFLLKPFNSAWMKTTGAAIYFVAPVAYQSLSTGSWDGLILFGCLPWMLLFLARASRSSPFGPIGGPTSRFAYEADIFREVLTLGFILGLVFSFSPLVLFAVTLIVVCLCVGSLVAGWKLGFSRLFLILILSCGMAAALNFPWILDYFFSDFSWNTIFHTRSSVAETVDLLGALRLQTELGQNSIFGWGFPALAFVPLLLARGERWAWAVRGCSLYLAGVAAIWVNGMGYLPFVLPRAELLLVPAALGVAVASAMGVGSLQHDLQTYRFGWRQLIPVTAIIASCLVVLPVLGSAFSGDWGIPDDELNDVLFSEEETNQNIRVLWIGDDDLLAASGQQFLDNFTISITSTLESTFIDRWQPPGQPANQLVAEAFDLALKNGTTNLGKLLAPFGITDVVLIENLAPLPSKGLSIELPESLKLSLSRQLDLAKIEIAPGIYRYRNLSAFGFASSVEGNALIGKQFRTYASGTQPLSVSSLVATNATGTSYQGMVKRNSEVYLAFPFSDHWKAKLNGKSIQPSIALGWGTGYFSKESGLLEVTYETGGKHISLMALQCLLWFVAFVGLVRSLATARRVQL